LKKENTVFIPEKIEDQKEQRWIKKNKKNSIIEWYCLKRMDSTRHFLSKHHNKEEETTM